MKKKGISLITLVITIIVVVTLTIIILISVANNNPINSAKVAQVAQTKDAINSSISVYVAKLKADTFGKYSSNEMLFGSLDETKKYQIIDNVTCTINEYGKNKTLYRLDKNVAPQKLGITLKEVDKVSDWYLDEIGKVYLVYDEKPHVAKYLTENDEILPSVSNFVTYAGSITETPKNSYTITFVPNGGTMSSTTLQVEQGKKLEPLAVTRLGYKFLGWYKDEILSEVLEDECYPTDNMTLYASWIESDETPYKVVHKLMDLDGETYTTDATEELTGTSGAEITPTVRTYPGFTSPAAITTVILPEGTTEVTYKYSRNQYTYTLTSGTGTDTTGSTASGTYYFGATITLVCTASSGYQNVKWTSSDTSLVANPSELSTTFTMPAGNIGMTSSASPTNITVTFNGNGGTVSPSSKTCTPGSTYGTLPTPTRNKYIFDGWYTAASGGSYISAYSTVSNSSNHTLYAHWTAAKVEVRNLDRYITSYYTSFRDALDSVKYNGVSRASITLLSNVSDYDNGQQYTTSNNSLTIDLNGYTLTINRGIYIPGTLTIRGGTIIMNSSSSVYGETVVGSTYGHSVTLSNVTLKQRDPDSYGIASQSGSTISLSGVSIYIPRGSSSSNFVYMIGSGGTVSGSYNTYYE